MTQQEAIAETQNYLHLIGREFRLNDGELETVKAVVAWHEDNNEWEPHVCFYNWGEDNQYGRITHMNLRQFLKQFGLRA